MDMLDDDDNDDDDWSSGKEVIRDACIAMKQQVVGGSSIHLVEEIVPPWHATSLSCFLFSVDVYLRPSDLHLGVSFTGHVDET